MSIYLNNLNNEIAMIDKFKNSDKKDSEVIKRKSLYIDIKVDIPLNNQIVNLII